MRIRHSVQNAVRNAYPTGARNELRVQCLQCLSSSIAITEFHKAVAGHQPATVNVVSYSAKYTKHTDPVW